MQEKKQQKEKKKKADKNKIPSVNEKRKIEARRKMQNDIRKKKNYYSLIHRPRMQSKM